MILCDTNILIEVYRKNDALIAATAIYHNIELFTLNIKDYIFISNIKLKPCG
jgi:predicted nucleic acid-binding protein